MELVQTIEAVKAIRYAERNATWGLVPTMGALHEGHLSLVQLAREQNDKVGVSIFVNPTQFNRAEDLEHYPRDVDADAAMLAEAGVDLIWAPPVEEVYPEGFQTAVHVEEVTKPLEGAARPGHFEGVTTIVTKLFHVFEPTRAYFGQKDAQQVAVIKQMVRDLAFPVEIVVGATLREPDGLALSSRNQLLSPEARIAAPVLYRALSAAQDAWQHGEPNANALRVLMTGIVSSEPLAQVDYISAAHPITLQEANGEADSLLLSMAVFVGGVRLIDNMTVE